MIIEIPNYDTEDGSPWMVQIEIPDPPEDLSTVDNFGLEEDEQYFKYSHLPEVIKKTPKGNDKFRYDTDWEEFKDLPVARQKKFIKMVHDRLENGYWFYNKGQLTWLPGTYWAYLNFWPIEGEGLPEYRDTDRRWFLFWYMCCQDDRCGGMLYLKKRRDGATHRANCIVYFETFKEKECVSGIVSKTRDDAIDNNFSKLVSAYGKLPKFLQMRVRRKKPANTLDGRVPNGSKYNPKRWTETTIEADKTGRYAFDGRKIRRLHVDEAGKGSGWKEADIYEFWGVHTETMRLGVSFNNRKALITTTTEKEDNKRHTNKDEDFSERFERLWDDSPMSEIDPDTKSTITTLKRYFIPAYEGLEGFIDKWGFSLIDLAKKELDARRKQKSGTAAIHGERRRFPYRYRDCFSIGNDRCIFNQAAITDQDTYLASLPRDYIQWGNLRPVGDQWPPVAVEWVPRKNAHGSRWAMYLKPEKPNDYGPNRHDILLPRSSDKYAIGADPYKLSDHNAGNRTGSRSSGAIVVMRKTDINYRPEEMQDNCPAMIYFARPGSVKKFSRDLALTCMFYGAEVLLEKNNPGCMDYFEEGGMWGFLASSPGLTEAEKKKPSWMRPKGVTAGTTTNEYAWEQIERFIDDYCNRIFFRKLLDQLHDFAIADRTKFDLVAALGWALTLMRRYEVEKRTKSKNKSKRKISDFFRQYETGDGGKYSKKLG